MRLERKQQRATKHVPAVLQRQLARTNELAESEQRLARTNELAESERRYARTNEPEAQALPLFATVLRLPSVPQADLRPHHVRDA